jgi:hypothetical protein
MATPTKAALQAIDKKGGIRKKEGGGEVLAL